MTDAEFVVMEHVRKTPVMFGNKPLMVGDEPLMVVTEVKVKFPNNFRIMSPSFPRGELCNG